MTALDPSLIGPVIVETADDHNARTEYEAWKQSPEAHPAYVHQDGEAPHPDDMYIWADGTTATRDEIGRGGYTHMSDDFRRCTPDEEAQLENTSSRTSPQ